MKLTKIQRAAMIHIYKTKRSKFFHVGEGCTCRTRTASALVGKGLLEAAPSHLLCCAVTSSNFGTHRLTMAGLVLAEKCKWAEIIAESVEVNRGNV